MLVLVYNIYLSFIRSTYTRFHPVSRYSTLFSFILLACFRCFGTNKNSSGGGRYSTGQSSSAPMLPRLSANREFSKERTPSSRTSTKTGLLTHEVRIMNTSSKKNVKKTHFSTMGMWAVVGGGALGTMQWMGSVGM